MRERDRDGKMVAWIICLSVLIVSNSFGYHITTSFQTTATAPSTLAINIKKTLLLLHHVVCVCVVKHRPIKMWWFCMREFETWNNITLLLCVTTAAAAAATTAAALAHYSKDVLNKRAWSKSKWNLYNILKK